MGYIHTYIFAFKTKLKSKLQKGCYLAHSRLLLQGMLKAERKKKKKKKRLMPILMFCSVSLLLPQHPSTLFRPMSSSFFSLLFILLIFINAFPALGLVNSQFELIHRQSTEAYAAKSRIEKVNELILIDNHRTQFISQRVGGQRRKTLERAVIGISSGAYSGTGQYFVQFRVGTPSQSFRLVADTGSDLTWMNCRYKCHKCSKRLGRRKVFHADRSSSFTTIPCSSQMCVNLPFSLKDCPTRTTPCQYDYRYADGSTSHGIFANETVTVKLTSGRKMRLHHVVVGCSSTLAGSSFRASDGVLGLGYTNYSFVAKSMEIFGGKFSYCLVDHLSPKNVTGYLTLGDHVPSLRNVVGSAWSAKRHGMRYTQLLLGVIDGFYPVNILGISIDGILLDIPIATWDVRDEGGVIIDSGTSLMFLAEPAYQVVMPALKLFLMKVTKQVEMKPFEYCFSSLGFNEALVPKLVIHFADLARFEPPVESYVIDVSDDVKCIGIMENGWPDVSIIGNIMQQNFFWEFDIVKRRLGFAPSSCVTR